MGNVVLLGGRITAQDPALLRYLEQLGLVPGAQIRLEARTPYGDVLTLCLEETSFPVSAALAEHLLGHVIGPSPD